MAGLASHGSAEPDTLVVRVSLEEREYLLEDAPETYYVTDYYRPYPIVLIRLSRIDLDALRDVLSVSWRLTCEKAGKGRRGQRPSAATKAGTSANSQSAWARRASMTSGRQ